MAEIEEKVTPGPSAKGIRHKRSATKSAAPVEAVAPISVPDRLPDAASSPKASKFPVYTPTRIYHPEKVLPDKNNILILNQGNEGSGVGFALADLINYLTGRRGKIFHASPRMLMELAKSYDGNGPENGDRGSTILAGLYGWMVHGVTDEATWPYVPNQFDRDLTPERAKSAARFRVKTFERVPKDKDTICTAILERGAVVCSAQIHKRWWNQPIGMIPFSPDAEIVGAGPFVMVGYTAEGFIIQLAWGDEDVGVTIDGDHYPGLAIWTYPDFEQNFIDAWVVQLPELEKELQQVFRAGYISDDVKRAGPSDDQLNMMPDVKAICAVLTARDVQPPLALGLFGNWGTGKSFFMQLMLNEINRLGKVAAKNHGKSPFYERIVTIEFNAWHYLDTNLWASLVSEIFKSLHDRMTSQEVPEDQRQVLLQELGKAEGLYRVSRFELEELKRKEAQAQVEVDGLLEKERRLQTFQEINQKAGMVAQAFGMPEIAQLGSAFSKVTTLAQTTEARLTKLWKLVWWSPARGKTLFWLSVLILGPFLIGWAIPWLANIAPGVVHMVTQGAVTLLGLLVSVLGWLLPRIKQLNQGLSTLEDTVQQIQSAPEANGKPLEALVAEEKANLQKNQQEVSAARARLDTAQKNVADLQEKLNQLNPQWQLQKFILERGDCDDYTKELGLVSLIHRDFDRLSDLLRQTVTAEVSPEKEEGDDRPALPFQRIILFIDDLDRCSPERVVDVLEAVHLLLAFPLFIVVVAVDPRWLRTCLEIRYKDLLSKKQDSVEGETSLGETATPQDYLEKIFQIPFYLRPLGSANFKTMVQSLIGPELAKEDLQTFAVHSKSDISSTPPPETSGDDGKPGEAAIPSSTAQTPAAVDMKPAEEENVSLDRLLLNKKELDDMLQLSPLFRTPRSVKRFINTYRLVRVGVKAEDLEAFLYGNSDSPARYRIAMALLAVVAGYPNLAPRFLHLLLDEMRHPQSGKTWVAFLDQCCETGVPSEVESKTINPEKESSSQDEWQNLCQALKSISLDDFLPSDLSLYYDLIPHVARFSFSVSDLPGLRKK